MREVLIIKNYLTLGRFAFIIAVVILVISLARQPLLTLNQVLLWLLGLVAAIGSLLLVIKHFKQENKPLSRAFVPVPILATYLIISLFIVQGGTLADYLPEDYAERQIEVKFSLSHSAEEYYWQPSTAAPAISRQEDDYYLLTGGEVEPFLEAFGQIPWRSFWWPGADTGHKIFDLTIYVDGQRYLRLANLTATGGDLQHDFNLTNSGWRNREINLYGDVAACLPPLIQAIIFD